MQRGYIIVGVKKNLSECDTELLIRRNLVDWFIEKATTYLNRRSQHWANKIGVNYSSITIKKYKSKWGGAVILLRVSHIIGESC